MKFLVIWKLELSLLSPHVAPGDSCARRSGGAPGAGLRDRRRDRVRSPEAAMKMSGKAFLLAAALGVTACVTACGSPAGQPGSAGQGPATQLTLYTSVTQNTVTAVLGGFEKLHPGVKVTVFRATTGQLNARIAADRHSGGLRADVIWGTDPLSMESYAQQGLLRPWPLPNLPGVPARDKTTYFWGTRELYLVIVAHQGLTPMPRTWSDLPSAS